MFNSKQKTLIEVKSTTTSTSASKNTNPFVQSGLKNAAITRSGNGAVKFTTTGNNFVDQFGVLSSYKAPRSYQDVAKDMSVLFASNPLDALKFTFYLRTITRNVDLMDGTKTSVPQRGAGLRHESIMRMIWLHVNHKDIFWKNFPYFISLGSWKDVFTMLSYDLQYNGWENRVLDWDQFSKLIMVGLENPNTSELVKKYLPTIKSAKNLKSLDAQADTIIGKWLCSLLFGKKGKSNQTYKEYRLLKSNGTAHQWQQLISQGKHKLIDFGTVHGRALSLMVSSKFLENQNLVSKYEEFMATKPIAKFTGYPHELFKKMPQRQYQIDTLNAQFRGLVETAKKGAKTDTRFIAVLDTSGSMSATASGTSQSCRDVSKAIGLFLSEMLSDGYFANSWIEFNSVAKMHTWKGSTPYEKWVNDKVSYNGGTNFQDVINLFVKIKNTGVSESDFPTGIICISDQQMNPADLGKTNVESALTKLRNAGFSDEYVNNFKFVFWNLENNYYGSSNKDRVFETYGDVQNVFYFSGFDPSVIAFLTGVEQTEKTTKVHEPKTAKELFDAAMDQEVLNMLEV